MLPSTTLRTQIYPILENFFKPLGWKYTKMPHRFEYNDEKWVFYLSWSFTDPSVHDFQIMHKEIDNLKRELNLSAPGASPGNTRQTFSKDGNFITTLSDTTCSYSYTPSPPMVKWGTPEYEELRKNNYSQHVNTLEELEKWIDSIYEYISGAGLDYIEKYKFLPNVLKLIDSEMDNRKRAWVSIRGGGFQQYTNVLLVAKLCSDTQLEDKISFIEGIINHPDYPIYDNGLEYWDHFKKVLKDVKPKYPHYTKYSQEDMILYNPPLFKDKIGK